LLLLSEYLDYHANIHDKYCKNGYCLWGWIIKIDDGQKTIWLGGASQVFWTVPSKFRPAVEKLLQEAYPWYIINVTRFDD
jgi:hypothetical protein